MARNLFATSSEQQEETEVQVEQPVEQQIPPTQPTATGGIDLFGDERTTMEKIRQAEEEQRIAGMQHVDLSLQPKVDPYHEDMGDIMTVGMKKFLPDRSLSEQALPLTAMALTTDTNEMVKIITSNFPEVAVQYNKGPDGTVYPILTNTKTMKQMLVNKPGLSEMDILQGLGLAATFTPAGRVGMGGLTLANMLKAGTAAGLTSTGIEGLQYSQGGTFDPEVIALDTTLGGLSPFIDKSITKMGGMFRQRVPKEGVDPTTYLTAEQQQLVDYLSGGVNPTGRDLPLYTSDIIPPPTAPQKEALRQGEQVPFGMGAKRAEQEQIREELVETFVEQQSPVYYSNEALRDNLISQITGQKRISGSGIGNIKQRLAAKRTTPDIVDELKVIRDSISTNTQGQPLKTVDKQAVKAFNDLIDDVSGDLTFENIQNLRTAFRENVVGDRVKALSTKTDAAVNKAYDHLTKRMEELVPPDLLPAWKAANKSYAEIINVVKDNKKLKKVIEDGEVTPELMDALLYSKKPSEVKVLYDTVGDEGKDLMKSGILEKLVRDSTKQDELSVAKFLTNADKNKDSLNLLFKGEEKEQLDGMIRYLRATSRADSANFIPNNGARAAYLLMTSGLPLISTLRMGKTALGAHVKERSKWLRNRLIKLENTDPAAPQYQTLLKEISNFISTGVQATGNIVGQQELGGDPPVQQTVQPPQQDNRPMGGL